MCFIISSCVTVGKDRKIGHRGLVRIYKIQTAGTSKNQSHSTQARHIPSICLLLHQRQHLPILNVLCVGKGPVSAGDTCHHLLFSSFLLPPPVLIQTCPDTLKSVSKCCPILNNHQNTHPLTKNTDTVALTQVHKHQCLCSQRRQTLSHLL